MRLPITYLYCCLFAGTFTLAQENQKISFSEVADGSLNNWISCITQDNKGFIWVGTQDGLYRYDGYGFEVFRNSPDETQSLSANWVRDIAIDSNDNYWIGTFGGGLTKFSPIERSFKHFDTSGNNTSSGKLISRITALDQNFMLSSAEEGFHIYNIQKNTSFSLGLGYFGAPAATSSDKQLWLAEDQYLYSYDLDQRKLTPIYTFDSKIHLLEYIPKIGLVVGLTDKLVLFDRGQIKKKIALEGTITGFTTNEKGDYFMATTESILKFYPHSFELKVLNNDLNFSKLHIETIFLDRQDCLWVGTNKGLYKEKKYVKAFLQEKIDVHARRIIKQGGALYLGGNDGIIKVEGKEITSLVPKRSIKALIADKDMVLAGADVGMVYKFRNDSLYTVLSPPHENDANLRIFGMATDKKDRLWVGSWQGLHIFDKQNRHLQFIQLETKSTNGIAKIINIHLDSQDRLWIITSGNGLYMIPKVSNNNLDAIPSKIINYRYKMGDSYSLTTDIIMTMEEDGQGQMWFGTEIGIVKYNQEKDNFSRLQLQSKLFDKKVMTLRKDSDQNLWITTINDGLYVYSEKDKTFRHFTKSDGLISNAFLYGSGFYDETTELMYFGTDEGVQRIDLSQPFSAKKATKPIVTAIQVNGSQRENGIAPAQAPFLNKISLAASQNDFSISFSSMDFIDAEKIRYSYTMDNNLYKMTDLQTAYFTNVPYGKHILKVHALYDGRPNDKDVSSIEIYVSPPWYYSTVSKVMYFLLLLLAAWGIYKYLKWRWKMQFDLKLKIAEAERFKKLNDFKSRLYTDIAHEFKTPLTLISGPIDTKLRLGSISEQDHSDFSMVRRNTNRMTALVDQLLQLAKLESGKLDLKVVSGHLSIFLNILSKSFDYRAQLKQIQYIIDVEEVAEVWYDEDVVEKVVTNLLSNAFKYTPKHGKCWFIAKKDGDFIQISVKNTVANGSVLQLDKLFTRFYQNDSYSEGVGVGLALVKELVRFYGGSVNAVLENEGIIHFSVCLPVLRNKFKTEYLIKEKPLHCVTSRPELIDSRVVDREQKVVDDQPILLIVEDHAEIRAYIKQALGQEYKILEAQNGKIGIDMALAHIPDIILSDIRMPVCGGIELCNTLKTDERTSHVPIILLTASTSEENELKGLDSGADDFMTKPFKMCILQKRLANLIHQRKMLQDRYGRECVLKPMEITVSPADEILLGKFQKILDENLPDPSFNATIFSEKANMSRMQLHRKIKAFTGLTTSAFIRSQRLKQAEHLLQTSDITINEVAYATGFNTPTYFMKCFKETFKKTPSRYLQSLSA